MKPSLLALLALTSVSAYADVACESFDKAKNDLYVEDSTVSSYINTNCKVDQPFSVTPIFTNAHNSGASLTTSVMVCCSKKE